MHSIKKFAFLIMILFAGMTAKAQKVDSIFLNLYTDSLKKGTHNYINVDGKLSDGTWLPLTAKEIEFKSSYGKFEGNSIVLPEEPAQQKITIRVTLKSNPSIWKEVTLWVKTRPDDEILPTNQEVLDRLKKDAKKKKG